MAIETTPIPSKWIGPIACTGAIDGEINVPMATYETTLWPSTARGAKISRLAGGINLNVISDCMTRSVTLQAESASAAARGAGGGPAACDASGAPCHNGTYSEMAADPDG